MSFKVLTSTNTAADEAPLIATNDDAFQSKVAAMRAGYFRDAALMAMADKYSALRVNHDAFRRPPIINRGTYARVLLKETLVESFVWNSCKEGKIAQIVSIGAGFDTHALAFVKNAKKIPAFHYVELDFPQVIHEKAMFVKETLLNQQSCLTALSDKSEEPAMTCVVKRNEEVCLEECTDCVKTKRLQVEDGDISIYAMRGIDLRDIKKLATVLDELALSSEAPSLIVAEIVLVYMEATQSDALISFFSERFNTSRAFVVIEHTCQGGEFSRQMILNIAARGSPLRGLRTYPTVQSQKERFIRLGYQRVKVQTLLQAFEKRVTNRLALNQIELLDEVEEWSLIMSHYCFVCASGGDYAQQLLHWLDIARFGDIRFRWYECDSDDSERQESINKVLC